MVCLHAIDTIKTLIPAKKKKATKATPQQLGYGGRCRIFPQHDYGRVRIYAVCWGSAPLQASAPDDGDLSTLYLSCLRATYIVVHLSLFSLCFHGFEEGDGESGGGGWYGIMDYHSIVAHETWGKAVRSWVSNRKGVSGKRNSVLTRPL